VVAGITVQVVVTGAAVQRIVPGTAAQFVVAGVAVRHHSELAVGGVEHVVATAAVKEDLSARHRALGELIFHAVQGDRVNTPVVAHVVEDRQIGAIRPHDDDVPLRVEVGGCPRAVEGGELEGTVFGGAPPAGEGAVVAAGGGEDGPLAGAGAPRDHVGPVID